MRMSVSQTQTPRPKFPWLGSLKSPSALCLGAPEAGGHPCWSVQIRLGWLGRNHAGIGCWQLGFCWWQPAWWKAHSRLFQPPFALRQLSRGDRGAPSPSSHEYNILMCHEQRRPGVLPAGAGGYDDCQHRWCAHDGCLEIGPRRRAPFP